MDGYGAKRMQCVRRHKILGAEKGGKNVLYTDTVCRRKLDTFFFLNISGKNRDISLLEAAIFGVLIQVLHKIMFAVSLLSICLGEIRTSGVIQGGHFLSLSSEPSVAWLQSLKRANSN
jgi:hypothetical protein